MSQLNKDKASCKDVFNAFLVNNANYDGEIEIPILKGTHEIPNKVISFSKSISSKDYNQWVHFYEHDVCFERIWRNPKKYLIILKKYNGVILPDFSTYRDMPLVMQYWNIYRSRAIGYWLQSNGVKIIPNIRYGDERTYDVACLGIKKGCVISVGSHGTLRNAENRVIFSEGLEFIVKQLAPKAIVVYGSAPNDIFLKYQKSGIQIVRFESNYAISRREVV